jgi:hypothetical protein
MHGTIRLARSRMKAIFLVAVILGEPATHTYSLNKCRIRDFCD